MGWFDNPIQAVSDTVSHASEVVSDIVAFQGSALEDTIKKVGDNPLQAAAGAMDPFSAGVFNAVLGTEWTPAVDQWGGTTQENVKNAKAKGINTTPGEGAQNLARAVATAYGVNYAYGAAGGSAAASGGSSSTSGLFTKVVSSAKTGAQIIGGINALSGAAAPAGARAAVRSGGVSYGYAGDSYGFAASETPDSGKGDDATADTVIVTAEKAKDSTLTMLASALTIGAIIYQFWGKKK